VRIRIRTTLVVAVLGNAMLAGCATPGTQTANAPADYSAIIAAADRSPADRQVDARRNPEPLLKFVAARPGMKVLDVGAGAGYSTELLARAVGPKGVVYAQNARQRDNFEERMRTPAMKNVVSVVRSYDDPVPPEAKNIDLITMFYVYHDIVNTPVDRKQMNKRLYESLRPGGRFIIADHSAQTGAGTSVTKSLHRIEEAALRREVEAAGFKLEAEGDFLRNPADPRDKHFSEVAGTPNDRFVLRFVRP
jgi:predicted methyltransferase